MVTRFGMSDRFGMMGLATVESQYLDGRAALTCGEKTASEVDEEVLMIVSNAYDTAFYLLETHRAALDGIADYLYQHETITGKEFMKLFREMTETAKIEQEGISETDGAYAAEGAATAEPFTEQEVTMFSETTDGQQTPMPPQTADGQQAYSPTFEAVADEEINIFEDE